MRRTKKVRIVLTIIYTCAEKMPGQIDRDTVHKSHFGGFEEDAEEEDEDGEVCESDSLTLACLLNRNIARPEKDES